MLIDVATAKANLRIDTDAEDTQIEAMIATAERAAADFLNRNVYADQAALDAAVAAVPADLLAATAAYDTAMAASALISNSIEREIAETAAKETYAAAQEAARATHRGIVVNDSIKTAILLITGHLYANREDVIVANGSVAAIELPNGSRYFLMPYRVGMGL